MVGRIQNREKMNIPYHFIRGKCPKDTKIFDEDIKEEALRQVYENCKTRRPSRERG